MRGAAEQMLRAETAEMTEIAIPLLCLIGAGEEACSHLQARSRWEQAASLAKTALEPRARERVLRRWASHLHSRGDSARSIEILLSLGLMDEVHLTSHGRISLPTGLCLLCTC